MTTTILCEHCGTAATLSRNDGRYCRAACRIAACRQRTAATRRRLGEQAEAALAAGDIVALERVARSAAALLAA